MQEYLELLRAIKERGTRRGDRTGTGTIDLFGYQMRLDLAKGFPLLTTKKMFIKGIIHELLWIVAGDTNIKYLTDNGVHIWDEWADANGDLGPVYGKQWRAWPTFNQTGEQTINSGPNFGKKLQLGFMGAIDQIAQVVHQIKTNPESRRHIVIAWNPADLDKMNLAPCHMMFQFHVAEGKLSCQLYQRSADVFLGVPFNIASYALLTMMMAQVCGLQPGEFVHTFGSVHIYLNHQEQVDLQLTRKPLALPKMRLNPEVKDIFGFKYEDFTLEGYRCYDAIKAKVAV